uniref:WD_REPEATS_REGION domain-containing protein n=1 Tax=Mesocestoides corti TaxID=53468 RepID=A0A5K3FDZ4_MESCO
MINATYVTFSSDGRHLLANLGGEHIYIYDTAGNKPPINYSSDISSFNVSSCAPESVCVSPQKPTKQVPKWANRQDRSGRPTVSQPLAENGAIEEYAMRASELITKKSHAEAVELYNEAIARWPHVAKLYTGRAVALIRRSWDGDIYGALADCHKAISLTSDEFTSSDADPQNSQTSNQISPTDSLRMTAKMLIARCLIPLGWVRAARSTLDEVRVRYIDRYFPAPETSIDANNNNNCGMKIFGTCPPEGPRMIYEIQDKETSLCELACKKNDQNPRLYPPEDTAKISENPPLVNEVNADPLPMDKEQSNGPPDLFSSPSSSSLEGVQTSSSHRECNCNECSIERRIKKTFSSSTDGNNSSFFEYRWRGEATDYEKRFLGHCNTTTDIKEATFFGGEEEYVAAGSDCGCMFIWDRATTNVVRVLRADSSTVNCVQPHPFTCLIASSGIDSVVRIWSPRPEDDDEWKDLVVEDHLVAAANNQDMLHQDPLEMMLRQMRNQHPSLRRHGTAASPNNNPPSDDGDDNSCEGNTDDREPWASDASFTTDANRCDSQPAIPSVDQKTNNESATFRTDASSSSLEPPIAACVLKDHPSLERTSRRRYQSRIVLGFPSGVGDVRPTGFVIRRRRRLGRRRSRQGAADRNHVEGEDPATTRSNSSQDGTESGEGNDGVGSGTVLELPCTTS